MAFIGLSQNMLVVHRVGITEEYLNEGHLRTEGLDPYLKVVLYWEMFYKQLCIAILNT